MELQHTDPAIEEKEGVRFVNDTGEEAQPLERCGFCGAVVRGNEYLTAEELNKMTTETIDAIPLGYCPNAQAEANGNEPERHQITRDMAIDAGDLLLEGQWM